MHGIVTERFRLLSIQRPYNCYFFVVGLSVSEASKLCNYMHLHLPAKKAAAAFHRANYDRSLDFLDSLDDDIPKGLLRRCLFRVKPKFHLARHVTSRHDSTRSTCRAHAFWLCRACRTTQSYTLDTTSSTGSTRRTCRVMSRRAKWNLGLT